MVRSFSAMNDDFEERELPFHLREAIDAELESDEIIRWEGQPSVFRFTTSNLPALLIGIALISLVGLFLFIISGFKMPDFSKFQVLFFLMAGIPFLFVGFTMIISPFTAFAAARKTAYVVTNKRAIIFEGRRNMIVASFYPEQLKNLIRTQRQDGSGNIIFVNTISESSPNKKSQKNNKIGFMAVKRVKEVENLLRDLAGQSTEGLADGLN